MIRIRIERLRAQALMVLLQSVIEQCEDDLAHGAMVTVESSRIRSRRLPLIT